MLKILFLAAGLSAAALTAQADPLAALREQRTEIAVSTRGVDFANPAEVKAFHWLLQLKAAQACDSRQPKSLAVIASDRACARDTLERAVASAQEPTLIAVHQGLPITAPDRRLAAR